MMKSMTQGNPINLIILFAIPVFLGNLFQQAYILSDVYILGHFLGLHALAVIGAMAPVFMMIIMAAVGFTNGLCIITAQRYGANDMRGVRKSFSGGLILSLICCTVFVGAVQIFEDFILEKMSVPADIYEDAKRFLTVMTYSSFATMFYNYFSGIMRALGDSKTPLYFLIFSSVLNAVINVIFIVYCHFDVLGVAFGTTLTQCISVALCLFWLFWKFPVFRLKKEDWIVPFSFLIEHLKIAAPMTLSFSILGLSMTIVQSICNQFGSDTIAAFSAASRIEQVMTMPLFAFGPAVTTYVAQNFGACLIRRIRQGVLQSFIVVTGMSVIMALIAYEWSNVLVGLFLNNPPPDVLDKAVKYIRITMLFYTCLGLIFVFRQALQGMGYSLIPLFAAVLELCSRTTAALYLVALFGYTGICFSGPIAWTAGALVAVTGYYIVISRYKTKLFGKLNQKTPVPRIQKIRV